MNILLSSHRRSGTHLLTDIIVNNFGYQRASVDLDCLKLLDKRDKSIFKEESEKDNILFWTHSNSFEEIINTSDEEYSTFIRNKLNNMILIYVLRDGRDVMVSYAHMKKENDINRFMSYSLDNWVKNIKYWTGIVKTDYIKYEDIILNYDSVLNYLEQKLNKPVSHDIKDVRLTNKENMKADIKYSCREFRKGIIGDHKNCFNEDSYKIFNSKCENLMKELNYVI